VILLAGFAFAWRRKTVPENQSQLSAEEKSALRRILDQQSQK
jgi:hypothetical protein